MAVRVLGQMIRALRHWPDQDRVLGLAERRLKPVPPDLCRGTVFGDEKIFGEMYFFVACGEQPCILRTRTHFTERASEKRLGGRE